MFLRWARGGERSCPPPFVPVERYRKPLSALPNHRSSFRAGAGKLAAFPWLTPLRPTMQPQVPPLPPPLLHPSNLQHLGLDRTEGGHRPPPSGRAPFPIDLPFWQASLGEVLPAQEAVRVPGQGQARGVPLAQSVPRLPAPWGAVPMNRR